ncbi:hypothetical protein FJZ28_00935 [Candidatus Peregrinibacteria bacterium]|nr:hypothetical protein [Candidatus Peregrinibacteria bacterium]
MRTSLAAFCLLCASLLAPQSVFAYNAYISDVREGEHPYESRYNELQYRKFLQKERQSVGYYWPENDIYYHPSFAKKSPLHPFYRKGGVSYGGSYAEWRGYMDPSLYHEISVDTYCQNFRFQRLAYRTVPFAYECFRD